MSDNNIWKGYRHMLIPIGEKADIKTLTTLSSFIVDQNQGEIKFLHVIKIGYTGQLSHYWRAGSQRVKESQHLMKQRGFESEEEVVTATSVEKGILNEAQKVNTDVIIMEWGLKPKGSISSRVSKLMKKAHCDVIVFKRRNKLEQIKNIVYPVAKKPSINRLRLIERFTSLTNAALTFIHVSDDSKENKEKGKKLLQQASAEAAHLGIESESELKISNNVFEKIIDISKKYDLMVLGPSGGWWLKRTLFGDKTDKVAENSSCSVLLHKTSED